MIVGIVRPLHRHGVEDTAESARESFEPRESSREKGRHVCMVFTINVSVVIPK